MKICACLIKFVFLGMFFLGIEGIDVNFLLLLLFLGVVKK